VPVGASVIKREQCAVDIGNREPPAFNVDGHHPTGRNRSDFQRELLSHLVSSSYNVKSFKQRCDHAFTSPASNKAALDVIGVVPILVPILFALQVRFDKIQQA
jgi:hypothetical protein